MLRRAVFFFVGASALSLLLPWAAYWTGLAGISEYPAPPTQGVSADKRQWVWSLANAPGASALAPLTPYSYLYGIFWHKEKADGDIRLIWLVAADYLSTQRAGQRMLWWHLSGASLTIWLSRNWTEQQITAAAFAALQHRGEVYYGD